MLHIKWNAIEGRGFDTSECPYREPACQCRRSRLDPWVRKIPLEGNGNPLQYSCLGNPLDRGGWWATVHGLQRVRHDSACRHLLQDPVSRSLWEGGKPCNLMSPAWWVSLHAFTVTCEFLYSWSSFSADLINTLVFQDVLLKNIRMHIYTYLCTH